MPGTAITNGFLVVASVASGLTVFRLLWSGLAGRYRAFTIFFAFRALNHLYPLFIDFRSNLYAYIWATTEPAFRILYIMVVLELYRLILEQYMGLYSLGRWVLYGSSAVAAIISILTLLPHITPAMPQQTRYLGYVYAFDRGVDLSLVIIVLVMLVFLSRFPLKLSRNVLVHATLYSLYFFSSSIFGFAWKMLGLKAQSDVNLVFEGISAACTVGWLFLLTPEGEKVPAMHLHFSAEYEQRALGKLDAINKTLLKISKS